MPFTFTMPKLSPTMEEGTIVKWYKKENDFVEAGELLLEIATDKATIEHNALDEGWLRKILIGEGGSAVVNQPLAIFTTSKEESIVDFQPKMPQVIPPLKEEKERAAPETTGAMIASGPSNQPAFVPEPPPKKRLGSAKGVGGRIIASPLAKRLAEEQGLDLTSVEGSGPGGRIVAKDLERAAPEGLVSFAKKSTPPLEPGSYEEFAMTPMRKAIAKRLQESKTFIPHFYLQKTINVESLMNLRAQLKEINLKVTVNDLIIRATALALRAHPEINRGFNSVTQKIIQFKTVDISVAVTLEEGLITPIIRQADQKEISHIAAEIKTLAEKARTGKLEEHEYKGGSFSISNLGMYGIDAFSAVINPPQAAILAIGAVQESAIVKKGQLAVGQTMTVVLSSDHRVIDGVQAAQFLVTLDKLINNSSLLLLQ